MKKRELQNLLKWQIELIKRVMKLSPKKDYELKLKDYEAELKILRQKS